MPLLWLSLAFLSGILLGDLLPWPISTWLALSAAIFTLFILGSRFRHPVRALRLALDVPPALLLVTLCLGAARFQAAQPALTPELIAWYNDQETEFLVEGVLVEPPDWRDRYTNLRMEVSQLRRITEERFRPARGLLLARVPAGGGWRYGDRVRLQGWLQTPPADESFSYRDYLARQGIYSWMTQGRPSLVERGQGQVHLAWIYAFKARALGTIYRLFPDPEASLLAGILLGIETGISQPVQEAFTATGTSHIVAISGFNMTIIAGLFSGVFGRLLGKRKGALAAVLGVAGYTVLVGAGAAVVRAALMAGLALFARQVGRQQDGLNSLAFVAALMAIFHPNILWDVGFQLSFCATLGLVLYAGSLAQAFENLASRRLPPAAAQRLAAPVGEYFLFTLAAQVTTLPITAFHFQRLSLVALLANPFILPAQPPVMILGGLAVLLGLVWLPLGQLTAWIAWPFLAFTIRSVELFARLPAGELLLGELALPLVALYYALLFGWTFGARRFPAFRQALKPSLALAALGALTVLVWRAALAAPDGRLHLTLLDTRGGEALLVQTSSGRSLLVNGGSSASLLSNALGRRLPLGRRQLDWLVVAAVSDEQLAALPLTLERFPAGQVLWAGTPNGTYSARQLQESLAKVEIPVITAQNGQVLDLGQGAALRVLATSKRGAVLQLEWGSFRAWLPLGVNFECLEALMKEPDFGPVSVLVLADGGYAPSNPPEWLSRLRPQVVLLSAALQDRRGLPDPETLEALQGYALLRTDRNGWIHISTDGKRMWVEVERR